jgi:hypothetical protein
LQVVVVPAVELTQTLTQVRTVVGVKVVTVVLEGRVRLVEVVLHVLRTPPSVEVVEGVVKGLRAEQAMTVVLEVNVEVVEVVVEPVPRVRVALVALVATVF